MFTRVKESKVSFKEKLCLLLPFFQCSVSKDKKGRESEVEFLAISKFKSIVSGELSLKKFANY